MAGIEALEQRDFFGMGRIVSCSRCGQPCRVAESSNPNARLLKHATRPVQDGLCANCAMTAFIRSVETIMYGITKNGLAPLRDPRIQKEFEGLLQAGEADATPYELDWDRVIANWDLPLPERPRRRKRRNV